MKRIAVLFEGRWIWSLMPPWSIFTEIMPVLSRDLPTAVAGTRVYIYCMVWSHL